MDFAQPNMCMMPEPLSAPAPTPLPTTEHAPATEEQGHEDGNAVGTGLQYVDYAHLAGDAVVDGATSAKTLGGMFETMGEDAVEAWHGGPSIGGAMKGASAIAAPLAIAGGVMDYQEGREMRRNGDEIGGVLKETQGIATTGSGAFGLAGLASGVGATLGPALGSFATGMEVGHYGDEETKKLGMYHDDKGNAESASDWAADQGVAADAWTTQHLHSKTLGTIAGVGATGLASIAGAEGAVTGAVTGAAQGVGHAAHKLWDWL